MGDHDRALSQAFDGQAAQFERAPIQSDPKRLDRLVTFARLPAGTRVLDAGCGPGLVAEAFLNVGCQVHGVDLSAEMVRRATERCQRFGDRARFEQGSALELKAQPFDAAVSRLVLHHAPDQLAFLRAQVERVRPGGMIIASDHTTDPDPAKARWHQEIERARDRTHTSNLTPGQLVDLFGQAGLTQLELAEEFFTLDFDEWFDRGTPERSKGETRRMLLAGSARGFAPAPRPDGTIAIHCFLNLVRGVKPA